MFVVHDSFSIVYRMLMSMKAEMEKSLSQVKMFKDDALKEREEVDARKTGVMESLEIIRKQVKKRLFIKQLIFSLLDIHLAISILQIVSGYKTVKLQRNHARCVDVRLQVKKKTKCLMATLR